MRDLTAGNSFPPNEFSVTRFVTLLDSFLILFLLLSPPLLLLLLLFYIRFS
jgi:hypothetical protein